jgi:hypothetical protein
MFVREYLTLATRSISSCSCSVEVNFFESFDFFLIKWPERPFLPSIFPDNCLIFFDDI